MIGKERSEEIKRLSSEIHDRINQLRRKSSEICTELNAFAERHNLIFTVNDTRLYDKHIIVCVFNKDNRYAKYTLDVDKFKLPDSLNVLIANVLSELLGGGGHLFSTDGIDTKLSYDYVKRGRQLDSLDALRYAKDLVEHSRKPLQRINPPAIYDVKFNGPATIVFWADGTKTVVKCQEGDTFDHEKGIAMAFMKKCNGNTGSYCDLFKDFVPVKKEEEPQHLDIDKTQLDITEE